MPRMRVISIEDHFWTPDIARGDRRPAQPRHAASGTPLAANLADLGERRLAAMDDAGIDLQVISHTTPGVQHLDPDTAIPLAREANDALARAVAEHPDRFAGFATLPTLGARAPPPTSSSARSASWASRARWSTATPSGRFLDDPAFDVLLARFERLGVPLYLHPAEPVPAVRDAYYAGFNPAVTWFLSAAALGWHAETGLHVLRMVLARRLRSPSRAAARRSATWARCSRSCSRASTTTCRPR